MKVDYHFHPNLAAKNPRKRLRKLWNTIDALQYDAMICTEHTFKDAREAYRSLIAAKPKHSKTQIFPGAELVSSDPKGVDVIAFAQEDWYDEHPRLLEPFSMPLKEMLAYLEQSGLSYFIPHPTLFNTPLKSIYKKKEDLKAFLETQPAFEAFNGCYLLLERILGGRLTTKLLGKLCGKLCGTAKVCDAVYPTTEKQFVAIGSDAHSPEELGFSVEIPCTAPGTRREAFEKIISNTDISHLHFPQPMYPIVRLLYLGWTTFTEGWMRREWRRVSYPRIESPFLPPAPQLALQEAEIRR